MPKTSNSIAHCKKCPPKSIPLLINTSHNIKQQSTAVKNASRLKYNRSLR